MAVSIHPALMLGRGIMLMSLLVGVSRPASAEVDVAGKLAVSGGYADNIELAAPNLPHTSAPTLYIMPALALRQTSQTLRVALDYELETFDYLEHQEFNQTRHRVAGNGEWVAVQDWFRVDGQAAYFQQLVDPIRPAAFDANMFAAGNQVDSLASAISPTLSHTFGSTAFEARYTYGRLQHYGKGGVSQGPATSDPGALDRSSTEDVNVHLGSAEERRVTWAADYRNENVEHAVTPEFRYDQASATLGYLVGGGVRLIATGGVESDLAIDTTGGGLNSRFWSAGFRWVPGPLTSLEARVGHRFFGRTYAFHWTREARLLRLAVAYTEDPTTDSQAWMARGFVPGELPPGTPGFGNGRITPESYILKQLEASLAVKGMKTTLSITAFNRERSYLGTGAKERYRGVGLDYQRQVSAQTSLGVTAATIDDDLPSYASRSHDYRFTGSVGHKIGRSLSVSFNANYYSRSGSGNTRDFKAWFAYFGLTESFGHVTR